MSNVASNSHSISSVPGHDSNVSKSVKSVLTGSGTGTGTGTNAVLIEEYIQTLNEFEKQGLAIAKDHLGPSFDMKRSSGFIHWRDARNKK
jgi:hypothetical protein